MTANTKNDKVSSPYFFILYPWSRIITALLFMIPAGFHYMDNEIYLATCLFITSLLRGGYYITFLRELLPRLVYDILHLMVIALLYINLLYSSIEYRTDFTSRVIMFVCIWKSLYLQVQYAGDDYPLDETNVKKLRYSLWDIYMCVLLILNWDIRHVSDTILFVDFAKGFFWGGFMLYMRYEYYESLEYLSDYMKKKMEGFCTGLHLCPFRK